MLSPKPRRMVRIEEPPRVPSGSLPQTNNRETYLHPPFQPLMPMPVPYPQLSPLPLFSQHASANCSPATMLYQIPNYTPLPTTPAPLVPVLSVSPRVFTPSLKTLSPSTTPIWPPEQLLPDESAPYSPAPCIFQPGLPVFEAGTFPAQPLGSAVPVRLHPRLIINPVDPLYPPIRWDIIHSPDLARVITGKHLVTALDLDSPAVTSGAKRMLITSDAPYLAYWLSIWGPIWAKSPKKVDELKVRDVLGAIHDYFAQPLTSKDLATLQRAPGNMQRLINARAYRIRESYDALPGVTAMQGFKRSDVMGGLRTFQGLRAVVFEDGTWKAYLGLMLGTVESPTL